MLLVARAVSICSRAVLRRVTASGCRPPPRRTMIASSVSASARSNKVSDRVRVIPNHVCVCVNLHEKMYGIRGDRVEHVWDVRGRGKLQ